MIKTSVIVPVYNTQSYLEECINSIYAQTQKEIEVIAVNDGSTDKSLQKLNEMKEKYPDLIIVNQQNRGPGGARNAGIRLAKGEYIYFCDSDDFLCDYDALNKCYQYAAKNELDVVMFDARVCGNYNYNEKIFGNRSCIINRKYEPVSGKDFIIENFAESFCPSPDLVYIRAEMLHKKDICFLNNVYYEDTLFFCMIMMSAERVMYIPETYYARRYRNDSIMTSAYDKKHFQDRLTIALEIEKLVCPKEIKTVFHQIAVNILKSSLELGIQNNMFRNKNNLDKMYQASKYICRNKTFRELDIIYQSTVLCGVTDKNIKSIRDSALADIFSKLKFGMAGNVIGIYGTGKEAERLFGEYEDFGEDIKAKLIYIMTKPTFKYFRGQKVVGLEDIAGMELDYILIASSAYEQQIERSIRGLYSDKYDVIKLYSELGF